MKLKESLEDDFKNEKMTNISQNNPDSALKKTAITGIRFINGALQLLSAETKGSFQFNYSVQKQQKPCYVCNHVPDACMHYVAAHAHMCTSGT